MNVEIEAIKKIIVEYEKDRKKKRLVGYIFTVISLLVAILLIMKGDFKINAYSLAPIFGAFAGSSLRYGSKKNNKFTEDIKNILE